MMVRLLDIVGALVGLLLLSPVFLCVALFVWWNLGWPVLYIQKRPGLKGKPFRLIKFRSMAISTDQSGCDLPDSVRLNRFGQKLRSTSLDELPELWNVLIGDMSFVGPRPLLLEYIPLYNEREIRRHDVKPGITGWAQINGRNSLSWQERFELDIWYVENKSIWLDIKILFRTLIVVLKRKGVSQDGNVTMQKFTGSR